MPLLAALDEYDSAITSIAIHAKLALANPSNQEVALQLIIALCHRTDEIVENALLSNETATRS